MKMKRCSHLNLKPQRLWNNFYSNIVNIPKFNINNSVTKNIMDPVSTAIFKHENQPSVLAIQKYSKSRTFHFKEVNIREVKKEILKL